MILYEEIFDSKTKSSDNILKIWLKNENQYMKWGIIIDSLQCLNTYDDVKSLKTCTNGYIVITMH